MMPRSLWLIQARGIKNKVYIEIIFNVVANPGEFLLDWLIFAIVIINFAASDKTFTYFI